jgi:hypothetical protein
MSLAIAHLMQQAQGFNPAPPNVRNAYAAARARNAVIRKRELYSICAERLANGDKITINWLTKHVGTGSALAAQVMADLVASGVAKPTTWRNRSNGLTVKGWEAA